jgi:hypothetical protein
MPELIQFIGEIILSVQNEKEPVKSFFTILLLFFIPFSILFLGQILIAVLSHTKQFQPYP